MCIFLLRFSIARTVRYTLYIVVTLVATFGLFVFFYALLQCRPPSEYWRQAVQDNISQGSCVDPRVTISVTYAHAAVITAVDWTLAIIPIFIIWNMNMATSTKLYIGLVLGLGSM